MFKDVVIGNGITALVAGFMLGCPVIRTKAKLPPVGSYLHATVEARSLMSRLGVPTEDRAVRHEVFMGHEFHPWPGPPEALTNHFEKTRGYRPETLPAHDASKRETVETSLVPLRVLWHLLAVKVDTVSVDVIGTEPGAVILDGVRVPVEGRIILADRPEVAGVPGIDRYVNPVFVNRTFWAVEREFPCPDFIYVADMSTDVFRVQKIDPLTLAVEQVHDPVGMNFPTRKKVLEALYQMFPDIIAVPLDWQPDPCNYVGFSDGIRAVLPDYLWPIGRAATGKSVSLHHVIADLHRAIAREESPTL